MGYRLLKVIATLLFSLWVLFAQALDLDSSLYIVYEKDDDLYVVPKDKIIILHGSIATPIAVEPDAEMVGYKVLNGNFDTVEEIAITARDLSDNSAYSLSSMSLTGDDDGDGIANVNDAFPANANEWQDLNGDGLGDNQYPFNNSLSPLIDNTVAFVQPSHDASVGATASQQTVGADGNANYTVPLVVPPGISGIQPNLALVYNNSAPNSMLGVGWALSGLSTIHRCPTNYERDNYLDGVDFDSNDKFCLDGQRLISIGGSQYRTENETFSKIIAYGTIGSGPSYFKVWTRDGRILDYGNSSNSAIEARPNNGSIYIWALNQVADRYGNDLTITYAKETAHTEFRPARIDYVNGNAAVVFEYDSAARPDVLTQFASGLTIKSTKRLKNVKTYSGTQLLRDYRLLYELNIATDQSQLKSITECAGGHCLDSTVATWENGDWDINAGSQALADNYSVEVKAKDGIRQYYVDANGDGRDDLVWIPRSLAPKALWVAYSNGSGFDAPQEALSSSVAQGYGPGSADGLWSRFADVNGDGRTDMIWRPDGLSSFWVSIGSDNGFSVPMMWMQENAAGGQKSFSSDGRGESYVDMNGDGRADKVWRPKDTNDFWVALSTGSMFSPATKWLAKADVGFNIHSHNNAHTAFIDLNGDGLTDMVWRPKETDRLYASLSNGSTLQTPFQIFDTGSNGAGVKPFSEDGKHTRFADVNGDGLVDYVWVPKGQTTLWVAINNGKTFKTPTQWQGNYSSSPTIKPYSSGGTRQDFIDINDDGMADNIWRPEGTYEVWAALSNGIDGFETPVRLFTSTTSGVNSYSDDAKHEGYADINGDGIPDKVWSPKNRTDIWVALANPPANKMLTITNGFGVEVAFSYKPLTDSSVYTKLTPSHYPVNDVINTGYVVNRMTTSDGIGGQFVHDYTYKGLRSHITGIGSLGFAEMFDTDQDSGVTTYTRFNQNYSQRTQGSVDNIQLITVNGTVVSDTTNQWSNTNLDSGAILRYLSTLNQTTVIKRDLNNAFMSREVTDYEYDSYSNITQITSKVYDAPTGGSVIRTSITDNDDFTNNATDWLIGLLNSSEVNTTVTGQPTLTRKSAWEFSPTGRIEREKILHPDTGAVVHETYYSNLDSFGNHRTETVSGPDFSTRQTLRTYDTTGRFIASVENDLGHIASNIYYATGHINAGLLKYSTDLNGVQTYHEYDAFGRVIKTTAANNKTHKISSFTSYTACSSGCASNEQYKVYTSADGGAGSFTTFDKLGRKIRKSSQTLDGSYTTVAYEYDNTGNNHRVSEPGFGDVFATGLWTVIGYDDLGRAVTISNPDGSSDSINYNGLVITSTNDLSQQKIETRNVLGQLTIVEDNDGSQVNYSYDSHGNMISVIDEESNVTTIGYDKLGRKQWMNDPDKGLWSYTYNSLGQLITQTDAKTQTTCKAYDTLGRQIKRIDNYAGSVAASIGATAQSTNQCDGDAANPETASWEYDTATNGLGKLDRVNGSNGYQEQYFYDTYARPYQTIKTVNGESFTTNTYYDSLHRVNKIKYPGPSNRLEVSNIYNNLGFRIELANAANSGRYYQAITMDERGNITEEKLGNGLKTVRRYDDTTGLIEKIEGYRTWDFGTPSVQDLEVDFDTLGNLTYRADYLQAISEDFEYDNLNRLRFNRADFGNGQIQTTEVRYDTLGNITYKTGVGSYKYGSECAVGFGPHAVCEISSPKSTTYSYDANGNMDSGDGRVIFNSTFDKPTLITQGSNSSLLAYGPGRALIYRSDTTAGQTTATTYINGLYEKVTLPTNKVEERHYIGGIGIVTFIDRSSSSAGTLQERYLHKDHLGSIVSITNEYGATVEQFSFDPWGKRRAKSLSQLEDLLLKNWVSMTSYEKGNLTIKPWVLASKTTNKGFTGHEQLDGVGLIHMGGRVYDAEIGRFLQADPFIQDRTNLQALNRYSYVQNNPLSYTDPSGYFSEKLGKLIASALMGVGPKVGSKLNELRKKHTRSVGKFLNKNPALQFVAAVVATVACYGNVACGYAVMAVSAAASASRTYAAGGSNGSILKGAAVAAVAAAATGGFDGGTAAEMAGQVINNMMVAGVASKALGGKFIDGVKGAAIGMAIGAAVKWAMTPASDSPAGTQTQAKETKTQTSIVDKETASLNIDTAKQQIISDLKAGKLDMLGLDGDSINGGYDAISFEVVDSLPNGVAQVSYDEWLGTPTDYVGVENVRVQITPAGASSYGEALDTIGHELRHISKYQRIDLPHIKPGSSGYYSSPKELDARVMGGRVRRHYGQ